jgi:hypothetical protein
LFKRVFDFARQELERRARSPELPPPGRPSQGEGYRPAHAARSESEPASSDVHGLSVSRAGQGGIQLAWSLSDTELSRARSLVDPEAVLCVRVVAFSPLRDDVLREVQDRPGVESRGACDVGMVEGRAIASIGLRAGDRYVSIIHHVL